MNITYRTRRRLQTIGTIALFVVMLIVIGWFCWVVWLERYIVYTRDGATIDFTVSQDILSGEVAVPRSRDRARRFTITKARMPSPPAPT